MYVIATPGILSQGLLVVNAKAQQAFFANFKISTFSKLSLCSQNIAEQANLQK